MIAVVYRPPIPVMTVMTVSAFLMELPGKVTAVVCHMATQVMTVTTVLAFLMELLIWMPV